MKKFLFSALVGAMIISCSRDNDNTNPTTPQAPAISQTGILPTKLTYSQTGKADEVITFSYDENKLVKLTHNNKDVIYTYTGDLITSINNPNESSYVFNYDSNGNLISEKTKFYNGTIKTSENDITYTVNGSTVTAQKISKNYDDITGTLSSISTSTITYTLDAKKRPIRKVVVSEEKNTAGDITLKENNTFTYQYANHHSLIENIVGFDKLTYSYFLSDNNEDFPHNIVSYMKEDINRTHYYFGGSPHNNSYINEVKVEYSVNANNYPIKIQPKAKNHINGQFETINNSYFTIEYNK